MTKESLSFEMLDEILDASDLYLARPGDGDDGTDAVRVRLAYKGRGYAPEGFALTVSGTETLRALLAAAGKVSAWRYEQHEESFDAIAFARRATTDDMGRDSIIVYWPGWSLTAMPGIYTD
jgi:hypothetical protein